MPLKNAKSVTPNDFMAIVNGGLARPNRFEVSFNFPNYGGLERLNDYVESVDFPATALATVDFQANTQPIYKVPYTKLPAQTCNVTFRIDKNFDPVRFLHEYMSYAVFSSGLEYFTRYPSDLWGDVIITNFNSGNYGIAELKLINCILTNIDTMQLSFDDRDSYLKQTVTFSYQTYEFITAPKSQ
jgi:hypothetical protein